MKRINNLIQKLASLAPKAAPLAIVVAAVFATSPMAFAQFCGFVDPGGPTYVYPGGTFPRVAPVAGNCT